MVGSIALCQIQSVDPEMGWVVSCSTCTDVLLCKIGACSIAPLFSFEGFDF